MSRSDETIGLALLLALVAPACSARATRLSLDVPAGARPRIRSAEVLVYAADATPSACDLLLEWASATCDDADCGTGPDLAAAGEPLARTVVAVDASGALRGAVALPS